MTFTWDKMLTSKETAPYLMYSLAAAGVSAKERRGTDLAALGAVGQFERALVMHLLRFGDAVTVAAVSTGQTCSATTSMRRRTSSTDSTGRSGARAATSEDRARRLALVEATASTLSEASVYSGYSRSHGCMWQIGHPIPRVIRSSHPRWATRLATPL